MKYLKTITKKVVNLAAQAGVRYSMKNPLAYINSNIVGFANILENCREQKIEHLVYAITSGLFANTKMPFLNTIVLTTLYLFMLHQKI